MAKTNAGASARANEPPNLIHVDNGPVRELNHSTPVALIRRWTKCGLRVPGSQTTLEWPDDANCGFCLPLSETVQR